MDAYAVLCIRSATIIDTINIRTLMTLLSYHYPSTDSLLASLAKPLTTFYNISFATGCIPDDWKLASIVPIHKKDDKGSVENYRPISLILLVMKIFERCIKK